MGEERWHPIPSDSFRTSLPWSSEHTFYVWRYGVGHSELELRCYTGDRAGFLQILFIGVVWMETGRAFREGITLTEAAEPSSRLAVTSVPYPLLLTELRGPLGDVGFVAATNLRVYRKAEDGDDGDRLLVVNKSYLTD